MFDLVRCPEPDLDQLKRFVVHPFEDPISEGMTLHGFLVRQKLQR